MQYVKQAVDEPLICEYLMFMWRHGNGDEIRYLALEIDVVSVPMHA